MSQIRSAIFACIGLLVASVAASANTVTLDFGELPEDTSADGASVEGVNFSFAGAFPGDAFYNSSTLVLGPADATLLSGSVLEGDSAGVLTIDFSGPTDVLRFAVLLSTDETLTPGFTVALFDTSLTSLGTFDVTTTPLVATGFSEGVFERTTGPLIRRAVIDFDDAPGRFALDNLTVQPVPEPSSVVLSGIGALALAGYGARRLAARA